MTPSILRRRVERTLPKIALGLYAGASLLALLSANAHGQTRGQTGGQTITPTLTVQGGAIGAIEAEAITNPSPEEARKTLEKIPGGVSLVSEQDLREGRTSTIKDVLDYVPGVFAQPKYGQEDARLAIRGSGLSRNFHLRGVRLLIDGVPTNQADGGGDFQEIDPLAFRYVEVYRGANALQFGAASLGGAVNYVSPTGRSHGGYLLRQEFGSYQTSRSQFAAGGVAGNFDYYITPTYSHSLGYRDHADQDYYRVNGNVGYRFGDGAETRFYISANNINQAIPGSVNREIAFAQPNSTVDTSFSRNTKRNMDSVRLNNKTTFLTAGGEATIGVFYADKALFHPLSFAVIDNQENNYGGYGRIAEETALFGHRLDLTGGLNYFGGKNHAKQYVNVGGNRGALSNNVEEKSNTFELYGEAAYYLRPDCAAIAGAQATYAERNLVDLFPANGIDSGSREYQSLNPKIGLRWDAAPDWQVFSNLSWAAEPPAFSELNPTATPGFAPLAPQKSRTLEIGTRWRNADYALELSAYRANVEDELQLLDVGGGQTQARNIDKTIHQGIELGGEATLLRGNWLEGDRISLRGAYTFSNFRFDNDPTFRDNALPGAPRHYLRAELRYGVQEDQRDGWFIAPNVEWVPEAYHVDNANTAKTAAYALWGLRGGYTIREGGRIFLEGRNLLDKTYIASTSAATTAGTQALYNPGDGRAVYAGIEWRF